MHFFPASICVTKYNTDTLYVQFVLHDQHPLHDSYDYYYAVTKQYGSTRVLIHRHYAH